MCIRDSLHAAQARRGGASQVHGGQSPDRRREHVHDARRGQYPDAALAADCGHGTCSPEGQGNRRLAVLRRGRPRQPMTTERAIAEKGWRPNGARDTSGRPRRKVLVLAYRFPPQGGGGVQRTLKFVKYLPQQGWLPIVPVSYTHLTLPTSDLV